MMPRSGGGANSQWIPLRDDYFDTPLLSSKESAYLVRKSCEAAQEVVERARSSGGPIQWRHVEKYNDVQLYAGFARGTYSAEPTSMCGVTSVPGTIKEVAALFDLPTTRAMKEFSRSHRDLFFDSVVLYTLSPRTKEKPLHQVTAKWVATRCPKGIDDRDYCFLECQDKFIDSTGRKGWVLCLHSIKLPGCEDLSREFGFVRGSFYHSGIVVVESDKPGYVDIIHMLQINFKNNTKMPQSYLRERVAWIATLKKILRTKRLNEQRYLSDLELVPKKYRSRCNVCQDSFSLLLLRKMNCRKCGEVVCGACSKEFDVTNAKFLETVKLRICMHCYQMVASGQGQNGAIMDPPRQSTSLSLLGYHEDNLRASIITTTQGDDGNGTQQPTPTTSNRAPPPPTKIFLQTMRQHQAERRSRHSRATEHRGHPRGVGPQPPINGDHPARRGHPSRVSTRTGPPGSAPSGRGGGYDARSLFDGPRGGPGQDQQPYTPGAEPPASLFDRHYTRDDDMTNGDYEMRVTEASGKSDRQTIAFSSPQQRSKQKSNNTTRDSRGAFKIPHSLYDYSALDPEAAAPPPPSSPASQRERKDSESSVSSAGSIDIDIYQTGAANADGTPAKEAAPTAKQQGKKPQTNGGHDDSEGSVGSDGDDDEVPSFQPRVMKPFRKQYSDDEEEETKSHEFESTPALPPPSPSDGFSAMDDALMLQSSRSMDLPFKRRISNMSDMSQNTTDCDTNYLDSEMRKFHGQPFYMRGAGGDPRSTIDLTRVNDSFMQSPATSSESASLLHGEDENSISPAAAGGAFLSAHREEPVARGQPPTMTAAAARGRAPTVTSPTARGRAQTMTSPDKPTTGVPRPPLYGRPKKKEADASSQATGNGTSKADVSDAPPPNRATSELSNGSHLLNSFDVQASMLSNVPSAEFHQDLTFQDDEDHENAEPTQMRAPPPPPPPAPTYVPSRFQSRDSLDTQEPEKEKEAVAVPEESEPQQQPQQQRQHKQELKPTTPLSSEDKFRIHQIETQLALAGLAAAATNQFDDSEDDSDAVDEDDVDFEELLREPLSNQHTHHDNHGGRMTGNGLPLPPDLSRTDTFNLSRVSSDFGDFHDSSDDSEGESQQNQDLLSARQMFRKFGSTKNLSKIVHGVDQNPKFQRTFDQIQESINMLSDSESENGVDWNDEAVPTQRV